ncbi:MAG TPA: toxin [Candidatus Tectomicrobia bacterium]
MKPFTWDANKNRQIQGSGRQVSFAELAATIQGDGLLDTLPTHRPDLYPGQELYIVLLHGEVYVVPFIERENDIHLITAYPSRKMRREYLR